MIRSAWFPEARQPPEWGERLVALFRRHEKEITSEREAPLASQQVLQVLAADLREAGFVIERRALSPQAQGPGTPSALARQQIDVFHPEWLCCLAIAAPEGGPAGAPEASLVEPLLVVDVDTLCLALPNVVAGGAPEVPDFNGACALALTLYGHSRVKLPYRMLLVGY